MASAVGRGRVRATDLVEEAITRIEQRDSTINAVVAVRVDEALEDAHRLDKSIADGRRPGRLAGLPVLVKDLDDVAQMRTTKGSLTLLDSPPASRDGLVPKRLRDADAIIVGKSNLSEFAVEAYTSNLLHGTTCNPWNLELSPGGSSGGSAAALAAGMVPIATATDGGGSIRIPASLCGLVGLKPTNGIIGRDPIPDWIDYSTDGPLTPTVSDARLLLSVLRGPVHGDPTTFQGSLPEAKNPASLLAAHRTSNLGPLPEEVTAVFEAAVAAFGEVIGLQPRWLEPTKLFTDGDPDQDWYDVAATEHIVTLGRSHVIASMDHMHPATQSFFEHGLSVSLDAYLSARRRRFQYVKALDAMLSTDTFLLTPTLASAGYLADGRIQPSEQIGPLPPEIFSTSVQNVTGHPAVSLPAGMLPNGLPFGLQITGPRFADLTLLSMATRWEGAYPWPATAPKYDSFSSSVAMGEF